LEIQEVLKSYIIKLTNTCLRDLDEGHVRVRGLNYKAAMYCPHVSHPHLPKENLLMVVQA